ncbi:unnamed protein product [Allacma fusca]|uniref:Single-stranded DNA-binding protein, mitochondrial n=1 Tax=Allacma fusca TaxID=39272 RepID=A0A8J2LQG5_9HEXA|nr:unnamed protein product [Allacma fusca]
MFLAKVCRALPSGRLNIVGGCQQRLRSSTVTNTTPEPAEKRVEKTMNQVTLLGRVGQDPQKRGSEEHPVVVFSLATHNNYQQAGALLQKTDWHRICVFKPYLRESVYRYMSKGQRVLVQGRITYGDVQDEHGVSRTTTSIIADDVTFFSKPTENYD